MDTANGFKPRPFGVLSGAHHTKYSGIGTHTRAGAAIFVQIGLGKFSETGVRVRACTPCTCGRAAHVLIFL